MLLRVFWPQVPQLTSVDRDTSRVVTWGVPDSVIGHRLRPNTATVERTPEFTVHYLTDSEGFRTDPAAAPAPRDATRIVVLGDSFAFGYGSEWPEGWAPRMARYLAEAGAPVNVLNTGTPGYDTRAETLMLEGVIGRHRPSVVLMMFLSNDVFTNLPITRSESSRAAMEQRVGEIGSTKFGGLHSVVYAKRLAMNVDRLYNELYLLTPRREYFTLPMSPHLQQQASTTKELLLRAKQVAERHGARLVVLSVPQLFQVVHEANGYESSGIDAAWIDREFGSHAQANGYVWIPMLDHLSELYRRGEDDLYYRFDGHLTPKGNEVVARFLVQNDAWMAASAPPKLTTRAAHPEPHDAMETF